MKELTLNEVSMVSGGRREIFCEEGGYCGGAVCAEYYGVKPTDQQPDYGQIGAGIAAVGLGVLLVSNPVGWFGIVAAGASSLAGGFMIGDGAMGD